MMYQKAVCFGDQRIAEQILAEGLCAKFAQNEGLKEKLKATGDACLAE